ncbi:uncharacterized protein MELLADRAFT_90025 [Melampsora larici-populina 98AG31]|uniref:Uncharacterized protein n=1 Tax=Melampsora larici-populina (strain 98AG31 / pathotype 3-4-7) TaxID=747676 RepID=F4RVG5_MELLP|nr:uncharacterized protein MELLADRAFT_90025 [Melampsora larici-populina 98AG31]EGG03674.1 hypothetical protein MELLADRAFT_90025 [Melampsora larici-populina 98AG31]
MSSQPNRAQPYSLTTPRGQRNPVVGTSANRSEQRSIRGQGAMRPPLANDGAHDRSEGSTELLLAAITTLGAKVEQEMLLMSDNFRQELSTVSEKIDDDIASLSNKINGDMNAMADKIDQNLIALSNKVDQVNDTVEENASRLPAGAPHGPPAAATGRAVSIAAWMYSPELKAKVYAIAYELVALPTITAYTALETPAGDLIMNSLFNTIKKAVRDIPGTWAVDQLPPVVNGSQDVAATQKYATLVKDAGKHARERLHILVLHNIKYNPEATVPCLKKLLHRAYWVRTPLELRLRIAYLRREAVRIFQSLRSGGGGGNIWSRVDRQLQFLEEQGPLYTSA